MSNVTVVSIGGVLFGLALGVSESSANEADALSLYRKKATWQESLYAAREALVQSESAGVRAAPFALYTSDIIRGGQPARHIVVDIKGIDEFQLFVTGVPTVDGGAATWANAKVVAGDGRELSLSRLESVKVLAGRHDIDRNLHSGVSGPLSIAGRRFDRGIHVYADSAIRVRLPQSFDRFEAWIGIDDWVGRRGAVRFRVGTAGLADRRALWQRTHRDFSTEQPRRQMRWEREDRILDADWPVGDLTALARRYARAAGRVPALADQAARRAETVRDFADLQAVREIYYRSRRLDDGLARAESLDGVALRRAIVDLIRTYPNRYPNGPNYLRRLDGLEASLAATRTAADPRALSAVEGAAHMVEAFDALKREALLANPLLDFERLLVIRRTPHGGARRPLGTGRGLAEYIGLPRQSSWTTATIPDRHEWDNELAVLSPVRPEGEFTTLYTPPDRELLTDVDLHFDGDRMLFAMSGTHGHWQVFEIGADGRGLRQVTPGKDPDVDNYDPCYLPSGKIAFVSTATFQGVPCNTSVIVGMLYRMDADGGNIRQLCFEQDHNYGPTILNDGRILYLRWEYTDTPHIWNRVLFSMNPDGTDQREYYGASSYWPNSIFYARPVPNHRTQVAGIVTGHHVGRVGELVIFDPVKGQREADGVVQRIPGYGQKVEPLIEDKLTEHSWPKFTHPYPLSDKYFLVSCKPDPDALWGIHLVDVFDNRVLIKEEEGLALLEPLPFRATPTPPVIRERVQPERKDAVVHLLNVYAGPGLEGLPRDSVKALRLFTYQFGYRRIAGINHRVGTDGPWEIKRVLGTVPVEADGSALFRIPANTPISVQPLDAQGKALQLMRSWLTGMPGENVSCIGCHENRMTTPPNHRTLASTGPPREIEPWHGPTRGFSFKREIQPVLDKYCVGCHDGARTHDGEPIVDLRADQGMYYVFRSGDPKARMIRGVPKEQLIRKYGGVFEPGYIALRRLVRVGGLESDLHLLPPMEFHADTSELVQLLQKGHHNVQLDEEAWDRLITWIDLNAPCHGTWHEMTPIRGNQRERRRELRRLYAGIDEDLEIITEIERAPVEPVMPTPRPPRANKLPACPDWPLDAAAAVQRQAAAGPVTRSVEIGDGIQLEFVRIPAGAFVMGDPRGDDDESPPTVVRVDEPFWMGKFEITNEQFARFDPTHDSRFEHRSSWIFAKAYLGWPVNEPKQPVVRVTWRQAMAFCRWLSERIGEPITLPSEAEWEYACRAGTATPLAYGSTDSDFSRYANLADVTIRELAYGSWRPKPPDIAPRDARFDDHALVTVGVGAYRPNVWGLHDMHGNAAEWTRTTFKPYPYDEHDGRNDPSAGGRKVVRGGSWYDRPKRARSAFRLRYAPYQPVFNVGFRVVSHVRGSGTTAAASALGK